MASGRDQYAGIPDYGEQGPPPNRLARFFPGLRSVGADFGTEFLERIKFYFTVFGLVFLAAGAVSIVLSIIFGHISVSQLVAWILIIGGVAALLHFMLIFGAPGTTSFLLLGILHLAIGLWLLFEPSVRVGTTFVWIVSGWLLVHGLVKLLMGYELRHLKLWPALIATGAASVVLAILNISLVSSYGFRLLGVLFGIDLAVTGLAFLYDSITALITARASASRDPLIEGPA